MTSMLRSVKFVRYIAGFARNVVSSNSPRDFEGNFVNNIQAQSSLIPRTFATQISSQHDQNLEQSLKRIDQDVRKSGRISRRDIEYVLDEIRTTRSATSSQSLLVIRCCGNLVPEELPETRTKLVQEIWNTLNKLNVPVDISHYNALLRVYLENEHPFSPTDFLSELESKGIEPNRVTYQRLIARYCQVGDIEGATKILEFMREKQLPVNENVFNALIEGHSQSGDMESAKGILNVMNQAGLEPSADTYTTLISGYAKIGDIETIKKLFEECESKELYLLDKDYLDIIYSLAINGHTAHIPVVLNKIRKNFGFQQDAINLCLRLINKGFEDAALIILRVIPRPIRQDGSPGPSGVFFIRQMVKANRPASKIIGICSTLEEDKLFENALQYATEISLELGKDELAYSLLNEMKARGLEIRQHYFWPLLVSKANDTTGEGIINVLLKMNSFNLTPSNETLREYVIPNIKGKSSEIIAKLRDANISVGHSASSLVHSLLMKNDIEEAAFITSSVKAYYRPDLLRRPLTLAFYKTRNVNAYITILRHIYENLDRNPLNDDENISHIDKTAIIGSFIMELCSSNQVFQSHIGNVLAKLVEQGLSISATTAEKIQEKLGEKMTDEISNDLGKLTSGELTPVPVAKKSPSYVPYNRMDIPQLERLIQNLEAKNQETKHLKRQLFNLYIKAKDLNSTEKLLEGLNKSDFTLTAVMCAQLVDLYAYHNNTDKAMFYVNKINEIQPDFKLDDIKIIRLSQAFTNQGKFDEGIKLLEELPREPKGDKTFPFIMLAWRYLNSLAEQGRADDLQKLFDILVKHEFIPISNVTLGPLIKVHLVNNDLDKALDKFEWCVQYCRCTPWKNELTRQLIQKEDAERLQRLTDLSTVIHGEINSLYDLVFSFVECGRIRQARKILETPGLESRTQRINLACERYQQEGMVKSLEGLKDATKDLNHIDRSDIYYQLLLSYIKQDDSEKALGLWTQMQEEDLQPSEQFLNVLGTFLSKKGLKVPFAIPEVHESESMNENLKQVKLSQVQMFRRHIKNGDLDAALKLKDSIPESFSSGDLSNLIEKLVQNNRLSEATTVALEMFDRNQVPLSRICKFLLNKLASAGDVITLNEFSKKLSPELKKLVSFDNRMCHAKLVSGQAEEYLDELEKRIVDANAETLHVVGDEFPRGGAFGILEKHPELCDKFENLAKKYAERGIVAPFNVLWIYTFINGNFDKASDIWKRYLENSPRIMFQRIVQKGRENQDDYLCRKLIEHLKSSNVTDGALGNVYSCLLDVLVAKENNDEVIKVFETAVKEVPINSLNRTAVLRVKETYDKLGKPFNFKIPERSNKNAEQTTTSSTSTSEEEGNTSSIARK